MITSVNYAILTSTLQALKDGNFEYCETLGFTFEELNTLNQLSLDEIFTVSRASAQFMAVTIQHDVLQQLLHSSRQEAQRQEQINRAINLGGSIALLNHFFGLTSNEVCSRRRLLGVTIPHGRTPIPDEETDAEIWQRWKKVRPERFDSTDALEAMMKITESFTSQGAKPSLTVIWNRISLCEKRIQGRGITYAG